LDYRILHIVAVAAFLAYCFIFEAIFSHSRKVSDGAGRAEIRRQQMRLARGGNRTGYRILEVNPLFFGGLPACVIILISKIGNDWETKWRTPWSCVPAGYHDDSILIWLEPHASCAIR
jgi:hypothetical protein